MEFRYTGDALLQLKWNGEVKDTVDATFIDHLLMTFNGGSAWAGNAMMDNLKIGDAAVPDVVDMVAKKVLQPPVVDGSDRDGE